MQRHDFNNSQRTSAFIIHFLRIFNQTQFNFPCYPWFNQCLHFLGNSLFQSDKYLLLIASLRSPYYSANNCFQPVTAQNSVDTFFYTTALLLSIIWPANSTLLPLVLPTQCQSENNYLQPITVQYGDGFFVLNATFSMSTHYFFILPTTSLNPSCDQRRYADQQTSAFVPYRPEQFISSSLFNTFSIASVPYSLFYASLQPSRYPSPTLPTFS